MAQTGRTRQDFVPADAILIQPDNVNAEVYFYDDTNGRPCARVFKGRRIEPTLCCYYPSTESRDQSIKRFLDVVRYQQTQAEQRRKERSKPHNLSVGDILVSSWGWEQTNVEFYKVVKLAGKCTVEVVRIGTVEAEDEETKSLAMQGKQLPDVSNSISQPSRHRVDMGNGEACITVGYRQFARPWNGKPVFYSSYA